MHQELEAMRKAPVIRNYADKTVNTYVSVLLRKRGFRAIAKQDLKCFEYFTA